MMHSNKNMYALPIIIVLVILFSCSYNNKNKDDTTTKEVQPRIVNIINFIRDAEPRNRKITKEILYKTVVKQIDIMRKYKLKGTFLLQYGALTDPHYQQLLKSLPTDSFEIGAWWEIPKSLAEDAGVKWEGKTSWNWDPYSSYDFSIGYSPVDREKLVETYMDKFKKVFGYYPKSAGSWYIDAYTLNYLYKKYHIVASCNCKDQIGTDGYTLWGGYWNQAYYPSKKNAYMPAQTKEGEIPVPVFRMLGSDPIRQYEAGIGSNGQGVITMEPVYRFGGGDSAWVHWYFNQFVQGESLAYAYVQVGQENSFTWKKMERGYKIQMPLIAKLRNEKKIRVETLGESGKWFRKNFEVTPPTAVTVNRDLKRSNKKTIWFDSRYYRMNLLWQDSTLRFRDIHIFDENIPAPFLMKKATSGKYSFFTLPFVDGHRWRSKDKIAGLQFKAIINGNEVLMKGSGKPQIKSTDKGILRITWPVKSFEDTLVIDINERKIKMRMKNNNSVDWFLDLSASSTAGLPFKSISSNKISCLFEGMHYSIMAESGSFSRYGENSTFRIIPANNTIILNLSNPN